MSQPVPHPVQAPEGATGVGGFPPESTHPLASGGSVPPVHAGESVMPATPTERAETEVSFQQAAAEETIDQGVPAKPEDKEPEDVLDTIIPRSEPRVWTIGTEETEVRQYTQRPLSFIAKMQWFALVGDVMDRALSGPNAMSLNSLFNAPAGGRTDGLRFEDFRDADTFVQAIAKLIRVAPDFLVDSYMIWLDVPDYEHRIVKYLLKQSKENGGLSDAEGIEMIEVFIDQNFEAIRSFFTDLVGGLQKRIQARLETAANKK